MDTVPAMPRPEGTQRRIGVLMLIKSGLVQFNEKEFNNQLKNLAKRYGA